MNSSANPPAASTAGPDSANEATDQPTGSGAAPAGIDRAGVTAWFRANVDQVTGELEFSLIAGGRSNLTFTVSDQGGHRWVLRRPPTGHLLPTAHDMSREFRIISAVGPAGVPAPRTIGYCADPEVTGQPFYVMEFVDGYILRQPDEVTSVFDQGQRQAIGNDLVDTLAGLHAVDPNQVGLGDLARREAYIERQLKRWYTQYQRSRDEQNGPDVPAVDQVHDLLVAKIPEQHGSSLVHGDYRLDNTMISADAKVAAVLDWELCTLGDPLADLGALVVYWAEPGEPSSLGNTATACPGFPNRQEVAERYAQTSGRSLEHLDFYISFAYWRLTCIMEGVYTRYAGGAMGDDGFDIGSYRESLNALAENAAQFAAKVR